MIAGFIFGYFTEKWELAEDRVLTSLWAIAFYHFCFDHKEEKLDEMTHLLNEPATKIS